MLKDWTREVLKYKPDDIVDFAVKYFKAMEANSLEAYLATLPTNGLIVNRNLKNPYYPDEVNHLKGGVEMSGDDVAARGGNVSAGELCQYFDPATPDSCWYLGFCVSNTESEKTVVDFQDPTQTVIPASDVQPTTVEEVQGFLSQYEAYKNMFRSALAPEVMDAGLAAVFEGNETIEYAEGAEGQDQIQKFAAAVGFVVNEAKEMYRMYSIWHQQWQEADLSKDGALSKNQAKIIWKRTLDACSENSATQYEKLVGMLSGPE